MIWLFHVFDRFYQIWHGCYYSNKGYGIETYDGNGHGKIRYDMIRCDTLYCPYYKVIAWKIFLHSSIILEVEQIIISI